MSSTPHQWKRQSFDLRLSVGASVIATVALALTARANSWFFSDDYLAFAQLRTGSLIDFMMRPIDVHFLPLHRLATWLIYTLFPLNFDVALIVMCAFHVAGVWLLYRTLALIAESPLNGPLTVLCGANFYAGALLLWWTVGIARFPYIFFSLAAIYQYLRFRTDGSPTRIVVLLLCFASATAFFTKAVLIPGFLGALELALLPGTPTRKVVRNIGVVFLATLASLAFYDLAASYRIEALPTPPLDWALQIAALKIVLIKAPLSLFGIVPLHAPSFVIWTVGAAWAAFFVVSVWRDPFNAVVWVLGIGVVVVNFLVITLSSRMNFGPAIVASDRYYFENLCLIVIFVAIIARRARIDEWLTTSKRGRIALIATWGTTALVALASQFTLLDAFDFPSYPKYAVAREFGRNLTAGIEELRQTHRGTLGFVNGQAPREILAIVAIQVSLYSDILPIFDSNVVVVSEGRCLYAVQKDGTIRKPPENCL